MILGQLIANVSKIKLMPDCFTNWIRWADRSDLKDIAYPGVYAIAISKNDMSGVSFSWIPDIVYIGMSNAIGGLKSRLYQFDITIKGGKGHGGASRFRFKHPNYQALNRKLYVSVRPFPCDVTTEGPGDLRVMGDVTKYEYECFALYVENYGHLPEFNDKKRSPKK